MTEFKIHPAIIRYNNLFSKYLSTRDFYDLPESVEFNKYLHRKEELKKKGMIARYTRLIIYPRDIEIIYGQTDHLGYGILQQIREAKGLPRGGPVLISDFCEKTGFNYKVAYDFINESKAIEKPWKKFYKTRDWYEIPESIDCNNLLYRDLEGPQRERIYGNGVPFRHAIYPKDIEIIFNCTREDTLSLIHEIRQSRGLSISGPLMIGDLRGYTDFEAMVLLDFIEES